MKPINWRQVRSYPGRLLAWLKVAWLPIVTVTINTGAIGFAWFGTEYHGYEDHVRVVAVLLQILGWLGVFRGVLETRAQFGLAGIWTTFTAWLKRFPVLFPKPITGNMRASIGPVTSNASATISTNINQSLPLDEQMRQVVVAIEQLRKDDEAIRSNVAKVDREQRAAIEEERRTRDGEIKNVRSTLTSHATGGINLTLCGAVCFLIGGMLGTLPYRLF
jgi:hypothetical protein